MKTSSPTLRASIVAAGLCAALPASAQLNILHSVNFDNPSAPWASTGPVSITGTTLGAPVVQNTDVAPGAGNAYSASFDGTQSRYGTDFSGIDTATTGYGVQLWVKNPGSTFPSYFWQNIASFGFPTDSGTPARENGIALGIYEGEYYGASNRSSETTYNFPAVKSTKLPGAAGSINGWDHLAFVVEGTTGFLYVNGALQGTLNTAFVAPSNEWHLFSGLDGYPAYTGLADELKFFTFASGTFQAASLDYALATAIPEPASIATLLGACALGLAACRRSDSRLRRSATMN